MINRRKFLKNSSIFGIAPFLPNYNIFKSMNKKIRTAHIGVGGMGKADLNDIASHKKAQIVALCDVDNKALVEAGKLFPEAKQIHENEFRRLKIIQKLAPEAQNSSKMSSGGSK